MRRVVVRFTGAAPAERVRRAAGVSEVEAHGSTLRCLVCGSFQPFLEALQGHEVIGIDTSSAVAEDSTSALPDGAATNTARLT